MVVIRFMDPEVVHHPTSFGPPPFVNLFDSEKAHKIILESLKSRIRETPTLLTGADSRTDTILERLHDLS